MWFRTHSGSFLLVPLGGDWFRGQLPGTVLKSIPSHLGGTASVGTTVDTVEPMTESDSTTDYRRPDIPAQPGEDVDALTMQVKPADTLQLAKALGRGA